jgi:thiol-disulfide isomerase/thioredoxin
LIQHIGVTKNNSFKLEFQKHNTQDIELKIGELTIPILVAPGDIIKVKIDKNNIRKPVTFVDANAKINNKFSHLFNAISEFNMPPDSVNYYLKTYTPEEYKTKITSHENRISSFLITFSKTNLLEKELVDWFETFIQYKTLNYLISPYNYRWKELNVKSDYWNFLDDSLLNNDKAINCSEYYKFAENYSTYLYNIEGIFSATKIYNGKDWSNYYNISIDSFDAKGNGLMYDILIAKSLYRFMKHDYKSYKSMETQMYDRIENQFIKNLIYSEQLNFYNKLDTSKLSENIHIYDYRNETKSPDLLRLLTSKYKGKVIYVDNWASWCRPCIEEMPHSVHLQEDYINKDVVFVYLCQPDKYKNDLAESLILKNQIPGEHYLMNQQLANPTFYIFRNGGSVPSYLLINKNGEVTDNNAPRPSSKEIRGKLDELLKM